MSRLIAGLVVFALACQAVHAAENPPQNCFTVSLPAVERSVSSPSRTYEGEVIRVRHSAGALVFSSDPTE